MKKNKFLFYIFAISSSCCIVCLVAVIAIAGAPDTTITPTPQVQLTVEQIIASTAQAAQEQTSAAQSPTPLSTLISTSTLVPSSIPIDPTPTIFIFQLQTDVAQPTAYIYETNTPFILPSSQPPAGGNNNNFDANGDGKVTCADFQTQASAQQAYNAGHTSLDGNDNDGKACESLP